MDPIARLCVADIDQIITLDNKIPVGPVTNIKPRFDGGFGFTGDFIADIFWYKVINYTVIKTSLFGEGGCQTSMAKNESDFGIAIVDFPVNEEYEKVDPAVIVFEEPLVIVQAYNRTSHMTNFADILQKCITEFSPTLWMALLFVLFAFGWLFKMKYSLDNKNSVSHALERLLPSQALLPRRVILRRQQSYNRKESSDPFFRVFCLMMQKEHKDPLGFYDRILSVVLSFSSLIVISGYFCNMISTELVSVDKPSVIESYEQILEKKILVSLFVKQLTDYEHFKYALPGSIERKLWTVMITERSTEEKIILDPQGIQTIMPLASKATKGYFALIITKLFEEAMRTTMCQIKFCPFGSKKGLVWSAKDPESPNYQKGIIVRQSGLNIVKEGKKRGRRAIEGGFIYYVRRLMSKGFLPEGLLQIDNPVGMKAWPLI